MAGGSRKIEMTWVCSSCGHRNLGRHKECPNCGDPKDASERFEMPGDTRAAPSVTDPELLTLARAGRDWRCPYCGADNRALWERCVQCGAGRDGAPPIAAGPAQPQAAAPPQRRPPRATSRIGLLTVLAVGVVLVSLLGLLERPTGPRTPHRAPPPPPPASVILDATVVSRSWHTELRSSRWRVTDGEGFAEQRPAEAFDVAAAGARHHHDEQVPDGFTTETYFEQVPYDETETYTEMVSCGEDCTALPQTCSESCSDDGNGFATCTQSCTGGGRSCTPRTCPETRTRTVTRYRSEARTREVPRFRAEPRDAPWYRWHLWAWVPDREAHREGATEPPTYPTPEELGPAAPLGEGERDRFDRTGSAEATIRDARGRVHRVDLGSIDDVARWVEGAPLRAEVTAGGDFVRVITPPALPPPVPAAPDADAAPAADAALTPAGSAAPATGPAGG